MSTSFVYFQSTSRYFILFLVSFVLILFSYSSFSQEQSKQQLTEEETQNTEQQLTEEEIIQNAQEQELKAKEHLKEIGLTGQKDAGVSDAYIFHLLSKMFSVEEILGLTENYKEQLIHDIAKFSKGAFQITRYEDYLFLEGVLTVQDNRFLQMAFQHYNPKKIAVNMTGDVVLMPLFQDLSDYITQNEDIKIYIAGLCYGACANYILPGAQEISILPYGSIAFTNTIGSVLNDGRQATQNKKDSLNYLFDKTYTDRNETFPQFLYSMMTPLISEWILEQLFNTEVQFEDEFYKAVDREEEQQKIAERKSLLEKINNYIESEGSVISLPDLSQKELENLLSQLTDGEINQLKQTLIYYQRVANQIDQIDLISKTQSGLQEFEKEIMSKTDQSQYPYSYYEFVNRISIITYNAYFKTVFVNQFRYSYSIPEELKFSIVVPEVSLLKKLGLNIISGENKMSVISSLLLITSTKLYLTEKILNQCNHFSESYLTFRFINKCTSE